MSIKSDVTVQHVSDSYMNLNSGSVFYDALETIMDFIMLYPLPAIFYYAFTKNSYFILRGLILIIPVFVTLLIRNYVLNNLLHYIAYIPVAASAYLISGSIVVKAVSFLFIILIIGISVSKRKKGYTAFRNISYFLISQVFLLCIYIASTKLNYTPVRILIIQCSILLCILSLIYIHVSRLDTLMKWEGQKSESDKKNINLIGIKTSILIVLIIGIFAAVLYSQNYFTSMDSAFISWLSDTLSKKPTNAKQPAVQNNFQNKSMNFKLPDEMLKPAGENVFMEIIMFVIRSMMVVIAALMIYYLLRALFKKLIELMFGRMSKQKEQKVSLLSADDIKDGMKDVYRSFKRAVIPFFDMSNNNKIRRAYYNLVIRRKKKETIIMPSYTPMFIKNIIRRDSGTDIEYITHIYEKARYGNTECTDDEAHKVKNMASRG